MHAKCGDQLRVRSNHVGAAERGAEIIEIRGPEGTPPYVVRWDESHEVTLYFPGSDAVVEPCRRRGAGTKR